METIAKTRRKKFDSEFKREAVNLLLNKDRTVAELAENLGVHENLLYKWRKELNKDPQFAFPGNGKLKPYEEEIRQLKKKLADASEERDILKKALAVFSRGQK